MFIVEVNRKKTESPPINLTHSCYKSCSDPLIVSDFVCANMIKLIEPAIVHVLKVRCKKPDEPVHIFEKSFHLQAPFV